MNDAAGDAMQDATTDATPGIEVIFPADFEDSYVEMRDCRHSHEHELRFIRVLASPSAQQPYGALSPDVPYPEGATLVKIEHDDEDCQVRLGFTAMKKLPEGASLQGGDWHWQKVDMQRKVLEDGAPNTCINCHAQHCAPPFGYDLTCAEER